jgi:hypothetical protein
MPARLAVLLFLLLSCGVSSAQPAPKVKYPGKSGIYAMTAQGPVELKVSGEPSSLLGTLKQQTFYSADAFDKIPKVDAVRSFYVSAMGWAPKRLYLVVGREALVDSQDRFQLFTAGTASRGVVAFEVLSPDLLSPAFVLGSIRKLAPAGVPDSELEVYLVLELKNTAGLTARSYPIRIDIPPQ